ncbi:MAG TPA: Na+/H+ antiporter [Pseudolabrys sp.]|jgi:CPA1 family monovalent cation:H+ antiporter|nr:Na+/H+ antiporter [Pseudolabrys sp.]
MTATMQTVLFMLAVLAAVAVAANRLNLAPSILLVVAGIGMALVPGLPEVRLAPEVVLLVILPPLIYSAGVAMSWREFKYNLRPIGLLAFGCVVFTTCAVAAAAHYLLSFDWATGFVLGAIIAPPDAVAPLSIAGKLGLPRRLAVVLEGEGLANDATALILYRFAVVAVATGTFSLDKAAGTFILIVVGEILYGIGVGWLSLRLRQWAHETRVEITLSLMTPYLAYWVPAHLGGSGVLATVACGLYVSWNGPLIISSATRLQGIFFWDLTIYLIEGIVFLLTGLQTRALIEQTQAFSIRELLIATAWATLIIIAARFIWVFPATYIPRWVSKSLAKRDPSPPWQQSFLLAFTGIRGVVSLAAALAIPYTLDNGQPFPHREIILFITFGVIVVTLVGQGLILPYLVEWLGLTRIGKQEHIAEIHAELDARQAALEEMKKRLDQFIDERELPDEVVTLLRTRNESRLQLLPSNLSGGIQTARLSVNLKRELIDAERDFIFQLLRDGKITDEARRRIEYELDLEEASVANRAKDGGGWI